MLRDWVERQSKGALENLCECGHPMFMHLFAQGPFPPIDEVVDVCVSCNVKKTGNARHKFEKSFDTIVKEMREENAPR